MEQNLLLADHIINKYVDSNCHIENDIKNASPHHGHDFYEIFIILNGSCIHKVNDREQALGRGDMVFIRPEDVHSYQYANDDNNCPCSFLNINFTEKTAKEAFSYLDNREFIQGLRRSLLPPIVKLNDSEVELLVKKSGYINIYNPVNVKKSRIAARGILVDMLTYFYLSYIGDNQDKIPDWFQHLLLEIQKDNNFIYGVSHLMALSDKSGGHLNRMFKKYLNTTPTDYVNRLKLNYAKLMLITTDLPVIDISFEAGFDNLSHFYHLFKNEYGMSPGKMRSSK